MKIPVHIIEEKRHREEECQRRREETCRLPLSPPMEELDEKRWPKKEAPKKGMIEIEL